MGVANTMKEALMSLSKGSSNLTEVTRTSPDCLGGSIPWLGVKWKVFRRVETTFVTMSPQLVKVRLV